VTVRKLALLTDVHAQPDPPVTATVPVPPAAPKLLALGAAAETVQVGVVGEELFFEQAPATSAEHTRAVKSLVERVMCESIPDDRCASLLTRFEWLRTAVGGGRTSPTEHSAVDSRGRCGPVLR
jgi:hypothetical protein